MEINRIDLNDNIYLNTMCDYDLIIAKYNLVSPNIDNLSLGKSVKELYSDLLRGKEIIDCNGVAHRIDISKEEWRRAIPVERHFKSCKRTIFLDDIEVSTHGLVRDAVTKNIPNIGDSNGTVCVKQHTSFSIRKIRDEAFKDLGEEFLSEKIWSDFKYDLESPAKKDNPNRTKCNPIVCLTDNRTVIYGPRALSLLVTGKPNKTNIKYNSKKPYYLGHEWRLATKEEAEEIDALYRRYLNNDSSLLKYRYIRDKDGKVVSVRGE